MVGDIPYDIDSLRLKTAILSFKGIDTITVFNIILIYNLCILFEFDQNCTLLIFIRIRKKDKKIS